MSERKEMIDAKPQGADTDNLAARVSEWVASPEGQASLKQTAAEVSAMLDEMEKSRRIDPELLRKPMTI